MTKFRIFKPGITTFAGGRITVGADENLNTWLEEHPDVESLDEAVDNWYLMNWQ